jgi:hypothetical protein
MFRKSLVLQPSGGESTSTPDREVADCSETLVPNYTASHYRRPSPYLSSWRRDPFVLCSWQLGFWWVMGQSAESDQRFVFISDKKKCQFHGGVPKTLTGAQLLSRPLRNPQSLVSLNAHYWPLPKPGGSSPHPHKLFLIYQVLILSHDLHCFSKAFSSVLIFRPKSVYTPQFICLLHALPISAH